MKTTFHFIPVLFLFLITLLAGCGKDKDPVVKNQYNSAGVISGDTSICLPSQPMTYCLEPADSSAINYSWEITPSAGVVFTGQGTKCITVTNWGNAVDYSVSVSLQYPDSTLHPAPVSKLVHAYPDLSVFDFAWSFSAKDPYYPNVTCFLPDSAEVLPAGVRQKWEIYNALNYDPIDKLTTGEALRTAEDVIPFISNTPEPGLPDLYYGKPYVIIWTLWYENQQCAGAEVRHKFWVTK